MYWIDCVLVDPFLGSCPLLSDRKLSLINLARYMCFLARRVWRLILLPGMGLLGFSITIHRQGAPDYSIMYMDQVGGGGGGGSITLHTENYSSLCIYFIIQIPPFIDWSCSACQGGVFANRSL